MPSRTTTLAPVTNNWHTYIDHTKEYSISDLIISNRTLTDNIEYIGANSVAVNPVFDSNGYNLIIETTNTAYSGESVDENIYHPYRPVFSSIIAHLNGGHPFYDEAWDFPNGDAAGFSAGVNCNGLICQAAAYNGSEYVYAEDHIGPRRDWGLNYAGAYPRNEDGVNRVWVMWDEDNPGDYGDNINYIVPGDMFDTPWHCGVIWKVVYDNGNNRTINQVECRVLEATAPNNEYKIFKNRNISFLNSIFNDFKIVRLRTKQE